MPHPPLRAAPPLPSARFREVRMSTRRGCGLWLSTFDTADAAARPHDAVLLAIAGVGAYRNFANSSWFLSVSSLYASLAKVHNAVTEAGEDFLRHAWEGTARGEVEQEWRRRPPWGSVGGQKQLLLSISASEDPVESGAAAVAVPPSSAVSLSPSAGKHGHDVLHEAGPFLQKGGVAVARSPLPLLSSLSTAEHEHRWMWQ